MPWAKLDDNFSSHPKIRAAWDACPSAVGLHALALSYCARHLTDGEVRFAFASQLFTSRRAQDRAVNALVEHGLWSPAVHAWQIHDYLAHNPSREAVMAQRAEDRQKKQRARRSRVRGLTVSPRDSGYGKDLQLPLLEPPGQFDPRERERSLEYLAWLETTA